MGMYTELVFGTRLKPNTPEVVLDALDQLVGVERGVPFPKHPFFETERFLYAIRSGGSYYFSAHPVYCWSRIANSLGYYELSFVSNIKNYDNEWQLFLDWIQPYSAEDEIVGYYRYEESDIPSVVWFLPDYVKGDYPPVEILLAGTLPKWMEE